MPRKFKMVSIWMVAIMEFYLNLVQTTIKFVKLIWVQSLSYVAHMYKKDCCNYFKKFIANEFNPYNLYC